MLVRGRLADPGIRSGSCPISHGRTSSLFSTWPDGRPPRLFSWATCATPFFSAILGTGFPYLLGLWLIGVAVALIGPSRLERPLLALVLFVAVLVAARIMHDKASAFVWGQTVRDYGVAASFAYLLYSMRSARSALLARLAGFNRFMADFSFSIYLIHFPLLIFLSSLAFASGYFPGVATGYRPTDPQGLFLYVVIVVAVYLAAWGFSRLTERHTVGVRRFLKSIASAKTGSW